MKKKNSYSGIKKYSYNGINYKSFGELKIAKFLTKEKIKFEYEKELKFKRIYDKSKISIIYPDFYIPKKRIIIEYFGMLGNPSYDKNITSKKKTYKFNNYSLISIYPKTKNWEIKILEKVNKFELFTFKNILKIIIFILLLFFLIKFYPKIILLFN